jgi:hypothetical protein
MPHFKKRLETAFGNLEFTFTGMVTPRGVRYYVSVLDTEDKVCSFSMVVKDGKWRIMHAPLPPQWLMKMESKLSKAIDEHNAID